MRVSFSVALKPLSGKQKFAMRLAEAMQKEGVRITNKKPHVNLVFVKGVRPKCKNIYRLDGVWMNSDMNYGKKNKKIKRMMESCQGIIYQNHFCKRAGDEFLGRFKSSTIILNGAPIQFEGEKYKSRKPYLLTFCRWRPHKRLKETVKGFLHSGLDKDYDLIILGDVDKQIKHPSVVYMGKTNGDISPLIRGCEYTIHLAYCDWCPNSVVESLTCGKNVLHAATGGTKEVVRDNGVMISDKSWDFTPIRLYRPPPLDLDELAQGYRNMFDLPKPKVEYLEISEIARQYINYCIRIIHAKDN